MNVLSGTVSALDVPDGPSVDVTLDCGGDDLVARVTRKSAESLGLAPGLSVYAIIKSVAFDRETFGRTDGGHT